MAAEQLSFKLCISGYRKFNDRQIIERELKEVTKDITKPIVLLHGCCEGVDKTAEHIAKVWKWTIDPHPADWSLGKKAGPMRNIIMANKADLVLCFLHPQSKGTLQMVEYCQDHEIPCQVVHVN